MGPSYDAAPVLSLDGFGVSAGGHRLLEGLDLELAAGEFVGLTGPSGCGKSTLLRAIAGLIDPATGGVRFRGESPGGMGWPQFRREVVLVAQRPALLDTSVEANLRRPFTYGTATREFPSERAHALLGRLGLGTDCMAQDALSLSEGQQQRLCLVRALLLDPAVLLLDEPTSALDEANVAAAEACVSEELERRALGVLLVTHDNDQVARWCHRGVLLDGHRVHAGAGGP